MLDGYLVDKIYELTEDWIAKEERKVGAKMLKKIKSGNAFEGEMRHQDYVQNWTQGELFCKHMARQLNQAGFIRDSEGNKIDSLWFDKVWNMKEDGLKIVGGYCTKWYQREFGSRETERLC